MIAFELSMPGVGSWNGKWSQEGKCFAIIKRDRDVPRSCWNKNFFYRWNDGWEACVSVRHICYADAQQLRKQSEGFHGYNWMISSIIKYGEILNNKEIKERESKSE